MSGMSYEEGDLALGVEQARVTSTGHTTMWVGGCQKKECHNATVVVVQACVGVRLAARESRKSDRYILLQCPLHFTCLSSMGSKGVHLGATKTENA